MEFLYKAAFFVVLAAPIVAGVILSIKIFCALKKIEDDNQAWEDQKSHEWAEMPSPTTKTDDSRS